MKVSVLGAGAIGSMLGGLLKHDAPDVEVLLIVRGAHGRAVRERGRVRLDGPWGTFEVPIAGTSEVAEIGGSDFVFVTVKSQSTGEAAASAEPYWGDATVISIQNGINDHVLSQFVPQDRLVMGMTAINSTIVAPGQVNLQLAGPVVLGPPAGGAEGDAVARAGELLGRINTPAIRHFTHPNALGVRYNKLAINALGFASSMSRSNFISEALAHRAWRNTIGLPLVSECRQVFARAGIRLANIPGIPNLPRLTRLMRLMNAPVVGQAVTAGARVLFDRQPIVFSAQHDIQQQKTTEIEYVNGELARLAASVGISAPLNAQVVEMVHELEARGDGTFFTRQEVIERFVKLLPAAAAA